MAQPELFNTTNVPVVLPAFLRRGGESLPPKVEGAYKTIREVSEELDVPQHVLRFWESRFPQIKPSRMRGSRRYYRPEDIETLKTIKTLLYAKGYTIKGAKKVVSGKEEMPVAAPVAQAPAPRQAAPKPPARDVDIHSVVGELRMLKSMLTGLLPESHQHA